MNNENLAVQLQAQFNAPVEQLYAAFYQTDLLVQWFAPGDLMVAQVMSNFCPGGKLRLVIQDGAGAQHTLAGEYVEIIENKKLVFNWQWQGDKSFSVVTLVFKAIDDTTSELCLTHAGLSSQEEREDHQQLWMACLEKLSLITL